MVLLRPALRSTAFGGGLSYGGPSIPLPTTVRGAEHRPPELGGALAGGGNDLPAKALDAP